MDTAGTSPTSPAASEPQGGTEDLFRELQPAGPLTSYEIWHPPPPGGRQREKRCSGECKRESCSSQLQAEPGWARQDRQQPTGKAAQEIPLRQPFSCQQADCHSLLGSTSAAACGRGKETSYLVLSAILTHFPRFSLWALQGLEGSGFLLLFRMFHFTLNLEPGLRPQKIMFWDHRREFVAQSTALLQEQKTQSYLNSCMWCSSQSVKPCQGSTYWPTRLLPSLILIPDNSAVRWSPPVCKYLLCPCYCHQDSSQFVAAMLASHPSVSKAKKGKCELLLVPVLFPILEQMPQSDARE